MSKIKIVTDSTVDLTPDVIAEYDIQVVPLSTTIDGKSYLDRVDITPAEFMVKLKQAKELPKSSQPAIGTFADLYNQLGEDGSQIISIHMTGGMSGTVQSAYQAAEISSSDVTVVDSKFISKALSFQVIEAAKMAQAGSDVDTIVSRLDEIRENTNLYIMVDTLEYLAKGGRIGRGQAMLGSLLNIKPILALEEGVLAPATKVRSHQQMVKYMVKQFEEDTLNKTIKSIGIAQIEALDLATKLKDSITQASGFKNIEIIETGPVISTHTGPGAVALMFHAE